MPDHHYLTSLTRIADFAERPYDVTALGRGGWADGDYVVGEVLEGGHVPFLIESLDGRPVEVVAGDAIVGALGRRYATLEVVGDWRAAGDDLELQTLTSAGVLGKATSAAIGPAIQMATVRYLGHVTRDGSKRTMRDYVPEQDERELEAPVILIIGTSMDTGKTVAAKAIVRRLRRLGLRVGAAKLTGVGRYRDILAMSDAGAQAIADFVDAGLPSTVTEPEEFERALRWILARLAAAEPDVVVAEAGASPLEPYNGETAVRLLEGRIGCTVLCASDPYAVVGVMSAFGIEVDLVSGRATSTEAGVALIERLCEVRALNLLDPRSRAELDELLRDRLRLGQR